MAKKEGEPSLPALVRPRSLSAESTRVLKHIAGKLKDAGPLAPSGTKVADATDTVGEGGAVQRSAPLATPVSMDTRQ